MSLFISYLIMFLISIAFSVGGTLLFRKKFGHEHLSKHNDVAGFIYAVIGVIYAVLLAFVVILVWEDYQDADDKIEQEANTISLLLEFSKNLDQDFQYKLQKEVKDYIEVVSTKDWEKLRNQDIRDIPSEKNFLNISSLYRNYQINSEKEKMFYAESIKILGDFGIKRKHRISSAQLSVLPFIWGVLIAGAVLIIFYAMLFSSENLWSQLIIISVLAISITLVLHLIYALDEPYSGVVSVTPEAFLEIF